MRKLSVLLVALAVLLLAAVLSLSPRSQTPSGTVVAGTVNEIESEEVIYLPEAGFYVAATAEGFVALDDDSRHVGERVLYCALDETFFSPAHGERFDRQGRYLTGPAQGDMGRFPTSVQSGQVVVDLSRGPELAPRSVGSESQAPTRCTGSGSENPPGFYQRDAS